MNEYKLLFNAFCYIYGQCIHGDNHNNRWCLEDDMFHDYCKLLVDMVTNKMSIVHPGATASLWTCSWNVSLINNTITSLLPLQCNTYALSSLLLGMFSFHPSPVWGFRLDYVDSHSNTPSTFHLGSNRSQLLWDNINITGWVPNCHKGRSVFCYSW